MSCSVYINRKAAAGKHSLRQLFSAFSKVRVISAADSAADSCSAAAADSAAGSCSAADSAAGFCSAAGSDSDSFSCVSFLLVSYAVRLSPYIVILSRHRRFYSYMSVITL